MESRVRETTKPRISDAYNPRPLVLLAVILAVIALLLFSSHRYFSLAKAIDGSLWGEFGDFIGGVVGTIIAYISIRLLVDTLGAQKKANQIASNTAKINDYTYRLQQLNDHFQMLIGLCREKLSEFRDVNIKEGKSGQAYLMDIEDEMRKKMGNCESDYATRNEQAIELYSSFYTSHRDVASVYFRIVYRLWELVFDTPLVLRDKIRYVKILRCQFSESELFLIRYNAMTSNGTKMQYYANQYNITKHLPELSLLEFNFWRNKKITNEASRNLLVTYFIELRKSIRKRVADEDDKKLEPIGGRYEISDEIQACQYKLVIKRNNGPSSKQGTLAAVFDMLTPYELRDLMEDFIIELFVYRSFGRYQKKEDVNIKKPNIIDETAVVIPIIVNSTKPLELYKDDDSNIINLEDEGEIESEEDVRAYEDGL